MMVKIFHLVIGFWTVFTPFWSSGQIQLQPPFGPTRIAADIKLDGILDEPSWQNAEILTDFQQALPNVGGTATERTEVKLIYDDHYLYIGIMAYDSFPDKIVARGMERDIYYGSEDNIGILLDTYNDKRQAIGFFTNALSARFDEEVISNGTNFNNAYNTFWNVKSRINEKDL